LLFVNLDKQPVLCFP